MTWLDAQVVARVLNDGTLVTGLGNWTLAMVSSRDGPGWLSLGWYYSNVA